MFYSNKEIKIQEKGGPQDVLEIALDVVRKGIRSGSILIGEEKRNLDCAGDAGEAGEGSIELMNVDQRGMPEGISCRETTRARAAASGPDTL